MLSRVLSYGLLYRPFCKLYISTRSVAASESGFGVGPPLQRVRISKGSVRDKFMICEISWRENQST